MRQSQPYECPWADEEIELFRDMVTRFLDTEMAPADEAARKRGHVGHEIWRRAGELNLLCSDIPEEYGGAGGDFRHEAVFLEEMARRGLTGMNTGVHSIVAHYLLNHGTAEQRERYLPRMARGELVGAIAMSEPDAGSDLQAIRSRAVADGDHYRLSGAKTWISNGYLAGLVLVVCKTDPSAGAKGTSILIAETEGLDGYRVGRVLDKIGMKAQDTSELFFDEVELHRDQLLGGEEGKGFYQLMGDLPYERLIISVNAVGAIEGALAATIDYTKERRAFGQSVFDFQNSKFKLAEIATQARVARTYLDRCIQDLLDEKLDTVGASMAKMWTTDLQNRVIDECLQLFGGYGYTNEYMIGRMYIDARVQRIYGGTNEIMKEVISRSL
ncbi:acyl-CoA dehydrogenase family protein [Endozoicomonas sp. G2_2]|uniref:acyl-CoA dehydrogenase family protein n=1 Tax=Endozoicomonas sp. G2_2 TaxID=2821092 RepID=UPI001ADADCB9|nr:acyl-CoA dehydrogenase family protein [Endozoicomonas sp. G2_2]MBO9468531.1 acyl-CoA dehydrogenase family protein [Endozoicomonas sp. G2_2]